MKNIAIPVCVLRSGDKAELAKFGPQKMTQEDIAQRNADLIASAAEQASMAATRYQRARAAEYPATGDQLDALWAGFSALANGEKLPEKTAAVLKEIQAVKEKYPKPE